MGLVEDNVRVATSLGAKCFVCDKLIRAGAKSIEVTFHLIIPVKKELHPDCASALCGLFQKKIMEAKR